MNHSLPDFEPRTPGIPKARTRSLGWGLGFRNSGLVVHKLSGLVEPSSAFSVRLVEKGFVTLCADIRERRASVRTHRNDEALLCCVPWLFLNWSHVELLGARRVSCRAIPATARAESCL